MSILVVGSIAMDTVETPFGKMEDALGGSALYFSAAASFFSPVNIVGVVGTDFDFSKIDFLKAKQVDFSGLAVENGETFRWGGRYHENMNQRDTLFTYLNVFEDFKPVIPDHYREDKLVFLANIDPDLQLQVLEHIEQPALSVLDTMNFWITGKRDSLTRLIQKVDVVILNDEELLMLTEQHNLYDGAIALLDQGLEALVIKKGANGAVLVNQKGYFLAPAYPVAKVVDPTGAGDTFAGGFLGYLSTCDQLGDTNMRKAVMYGTILASFAVEDFSFRCLQTLQQGDIENRLQSIREMMAF